MRTDSGRSTDYEKDRRLGANAPPAEPEPDDDPRLLDLEEEEESPFLRGQKRVPVRRGALPRKTANRVKLALMGLTALVVAGGCAGLAYQYATTSPRFRIASSESIEVLGTENVPRKQVLEVFGADIGRNIFFVDLEERRRELEEIPWVETASVMRLLPDRIKIDIRERTPVAFVQVGSRIALMDAQGVLMDLPAARRQKYSFPVLSGVGEAEPPSTRTARMRIYNQLMAELDSEGAGYSRDLSEVDLSDPEDVKVVVADPKGAVLLHLGSSDFLARYKVWMAHAQKWRAEYQKLESVDLRYDRQVIVNPDLRPNGVPPPAVPSNGSRRTQ